MNLASTIRKMGQPLEEKANFSDKEIKMAIGIASDPRYKKGNMTGAVQAIEKIKKGLSDHPQVHAVLRRQNEEVELDESMSARTSERFQSAEAELAAYAKKSGGDDKKDFMDVAKMLGQIGRLNILQSGQIMSRLNRKLSDMDTDPRDKVYSILKAKGLMESLQEAPEDNEPASPDEGSMAKKQLEFIEYAADEIGEYLEKGGAFPEWMQNKLTEAHTTMEDLHSSIGEHGEDEDELDEDFYNVVYRDKSGKVQGEKEFDSKSAAEKYAKLGNSRDKVGGKYTVNLVRDGGMGRKNEEVQFDEAFESEFEEPKLSFEDTLKAILEGKTVKKEDNTNDKSDDGEGMDKVQPKALKKKFKDRKDKDIDNDGDVDDSDEYLHKKRKATSKAIEKDSGKAEKEQEKEVSDKEDEPKGTIGKTKKQTKVDVNPNLDEESEMTDAQMKKRDEIMKGLEKKKGDFVKKYGDRAKEVMARTAIKMAMKESTAAYGKSQRAIADKKKNDAISSSDKNKLGKLADLMNREKQLKNKTK